MLCWGCMYGVYSGAVLCCVGGVGCIVELCCAVLGMGTCQPIHLTVCVHAVVIAFLIDCWM